MLSENYYPPSGGVTVGVIDGVEDGTGVIVAGTVTVGVGEMVAVGSATPVIKYTRLTTSPILPSKPRSRPLYVTRNPAPLPVRIAICSAASNNFISPGIKRPSKTTSPSTEILAKVRSTAKMLTATFAFEIGVAQGIGLALYEKVVWKEGRMQNAQMTNYIMPTSLDVPDIYVEFDDRATRLGTPVAHGPRGAKGIGELPLDGSAPAVASAVQHATGVLCGSVPMTPEDLMQALEAAR